MSFKLLRNCGGLTATDTADDTAVNKHLGKLSWASSYRVTEYAGKDVLFLIQPNNTGAPSVTATNGFYLKASSTITVIPEERPTTSPGTAVTLSGTDSDSSDAGDNVLLEEGTVGSEYDDGSFLVYDFAPTGYEISVKNETDGQDAAVYVEEVVIGTTGI